MTGPLKVVVVDDSALFLETLCDYLTSTCGMEIVGRATSALEGLEIIERCSPELVFMDVEMPELNGVDAAARIRRTGDLPQVILMSAFRSELWRWQQAQADALVAKEDLHLELPALLDARFAANRTRPGN